VPTSCSWLNAVEGFFAKLSKRRLKRGVFNSIVDLQAAINRFVRDHNTEPKPFVWTADPDRIIAAVKRGHQTLDSIHSHVRHFKERVGKFVRLHWQALRSDGCPWAKQEARSMRRRLIML
jgi:hypothetical protein